MTFTNCNQCNVMLLISPLASLPRFEQMPTYSAVRYLFLEQESLQDCMEVVNESDSSLSEPHPLCALAAMFVLAQGELVCN